MEVHGERQLVKCLLGILLPTGAFVALLGCNSILGIDELTYDWTSSTGPTATGGQAGQAGSGGAGTNSGTGTDTGGTGQGGAGGTGQGGAGGASQGGAGGVAQGGAGGGVVGLPCGVGQYCTNSICCVNSANSTVTSCQIPGSCADGFFQVECYRPTDCPGQFCCGRFSGYVYDWVRCETNCNGADKVIVCSEDPSVCVGGANCSVSSALPVGYAICIM